MATTLYKISEQILRLLDGNPRASGRTHINEIKLLVGQVANSLLKADHFNVNTPEGDTIPNNCMVYTYDNIAVTTYKDKSKCTLPFIPISLPRNMGVLHVAPSDAIDEPFIPIPTSLFGIVAPQRLLGELSGLVGYEVVGKDVIFTEDITADVEEVYMRLVGLDVSQLGDFDMLPLSSDMEAQVIETVYKLLVGVPEMDRTADSND